MSCTIKRSYCHTINAIKRLDFVPLTLIRLYLAPIFIIAGYNKYANFDDVVMWFGDTQWGLGLPFAPVLVALTIMAELVGGVALALGVATRPFSVMLLITMAVAMVKVHWQHGWHAITPTDPSSSMASLFAFTQAGQDSLANSAQAAQRLSRAKEILQTHGNYDYLTETGNFVVLNNGIEFGATYFVMLLVLLVYGAGFFSVDNLLKYAFFHKVK